MQILGINMAVGIEGSIGKPMIREGREVHLFVRRSLRDVFRKVPTFCLEVKVISVPITWYPDFMLVILLSMEDYVITSFYCFDALFYFLLFHQNMMLEFCTLKSVKFPNIDEFISSLSVTLSIPLLIFKLSTDKIH